jgi:hypothetical protein
MNHTRPSFPARNEPVAIGKPVLAHGAVRHAWRDFLEVKVLSWP